MLNGNTPLAVAEACSGLRMLMAFVIVAAFIAYMVKRPRWQKAVLLASSIPVAVVCNMIRIFATAMLMLYVSVETAQKFFHDFAGFVMMPVAVLLLFGEIWLMDRVVVPEPNLQQGRPSAQAKPSMHA
jgi:exosortase